MKAIDILWMLICFNIGVMIVTNVFGTLFAGVGYYNIIGVVSVGTITGIILGIAGWFFAGLLGANPVQLAMITGFGAFVVTALWGNSFTILHNTAKILDGGTEGIATLVVDIFVVVGYILLLYAVIQFGTGGWKSHD